MKILQMATVYFDFQKLEVYKKALKFYLNAMNQLKTVAVEKHVRDQLLRASYSVVLNIAEGSGRTTAADRRHFFIMARQ
jgi:four helix bundle protein